MKKNIVFIIGLLFAISYAKADFNSIINIKLQNNIGLSQDQFSFGAQTGATDTIDKALGEFEIPPIDPMPGVLAAMFDMDTLHLDGIFSYRDYRSVPDTKDYFMHQYLMQVSFAMGDTLNIIWGKLPGNIDSAIIQDYVLGTLVYADMKKQTQVAVGNTFINKFTIKVWYNKFKSEFTDYPSSNDLLLFPNPGSKVINVEAGEEFKKYEIFSVAGELVQSDNFNGKNINIPHLVDGVYSVKFTGDKTGTKVARFVNLTK